MASMVIGLLVVDPRLMMPKKKSFNKSRDECEKQADTAHEKSQSNLLIYIYLYFITIQLNTLFG